MATGRCEFDKAILTAGVHLQAPDGRVGANRWRPVEPQALSAYISIAPLIAGHPRGAPCATESQFAANRETGAKSGSDANLLITLRPTCPPKQRRARFGSAPALAGDGIRVSYADLDDAQHASAVRCGVRGCSKAKSSGCRASFN